MAYSASCGSLYSHKEEEVPQEKSNCQVEVDEVVYCSQKSFAEEW